MITSLPVRGRKQAVGIAVVMMNAGAHDYILKGNLARLVPAAEREIREASVRRERKGSERALLEIEERFRVAQELSPDGFAILRPIRDPSGHVTDFTWVYGNADLGRINGTNPAAIAGRTLLEAFPSAHSSEFLRVCREVAETGAPRVFEAPHSGDSMPEGAWLRVAAVAVSGDVATLVQDITERKRSEHVFRENEERLRLTLDAAQVARKSTGPRRADLSGTR